VIDKALAMPGFEADAPGKEVMVGFGQQRGYGRGRRR
jgi:hypothetical protein